MAKVEFGSVRFFRRLITLVTISIIVILIVLLIFANQKLKYAEGQLDYYIDSCETMAKTSYNINQSGEEHFEYEELFPTLYAERQIYKKVYDSERFFYLTFMGGPSQRTSEILDVLAEKDVKATFFVSGGVNEESAEIMKRIVDEGHAIGIYRSTNKPMSEIYSSVDNYLEEFENAYRNVYEATGYMPSIFRFAGGTTNKYNVLIREPLVAEMIRRGFTYYDWNATGGDNVSGTGVEQIVENSKNTIGEKQRVFLNLHDSKEMVYTALAVSEIIDYYRGKSYVFEAISNEIKPMAFD